MTKTGWKDTGEVQALTFDCYGTLIDWETGLKRALEEEGIFDLIPESEDAFLERRLKKEIEWQRLPYRHYREIVALSLQDALREVDVKLDDQTAFRFAESIKNWEPFEDTVSALRRLGSHWPMSILSNVERITLRNSVDRMGIPFAEMVTAEDVRSYKPAMLHFEEARRRLGDRAAGQLHIAASRFHDLEPCREAGIPVIWVNRKGEKVPDDHGAILVVKDLVSVCEHLGV